MNLNAKLITLIGTTAASFLAPKVTTTVWKTVFGSPPPSEDSDAAHQNLVQIAVFAALSAVVATLLRQLATKGTNRVIALEEEEEQTHAQKASTKKAGANKAGAKAKGGKTTASS